MSMDLQELMNGLFLLIGILGIMVPLGKAVGTFPTDWGVVALIALSVTFFHFTKIPRGDGLKTSNTTDKFEMKGGVRLWNW